LDRHWIAAGLLQLCVLWHVTLLTFKGYRECRMLRHELFAKLHNANITQPSFLSISIGYLCMAELTTRLLSFVIKSSNCNNLCTLLVYSRHTDSRVRSSTSDLLSTQSLSTNIATRRYSVLTIWKSLPAFVRTADSFTGSRSFKAYMFTKHL